MADENKTEKAEPNVVEAKLEALSNGVQSVITKFEEKDAEIAKVAKSVEDARAEVAKISKEMGRIDGKLAERDDFLKAAYGKSGAEDWKHGITKWFYAARAHAKNGGHVPDELKGTDMDLEKVSMLRDEMKRDDGAEGERQKLVHVEEIKAIANQRFNVRDMGARNALAAYQKAATFTTTTDATAGYLVPDMYMPGIIASESVYGNIRPLFMNLTVPAGVTLKINDRLTRAVTYWRGTQGNNMTEDAQTYGQATLTPELSGSFFSIANEIFDLPGTGLVPDLLAGMSEGIMEREEEDIIQGDADALGTDLDPPSDGFLTSTAGASDQTNIAGDTVQDLITFLQESYTDYNALQRTGDTALLMNYYKALALSKQSVGAAELTGLLSWGDSSKGLPPSFMGYPLYFSPAMKVSTTYWAALLKPRKEVIVGNSGRLAVDFNPYGGASDDDEGWTSFETWVRMVTHTDWAFPKPTQISIADYA